MSKPPRPARAHPPTIVLGALIAIGAGLGIVVGLLFGNMLIGMLIGAGLGTLIGALHAQSA